MDWLNDHHGALNLGINAAMLAVWIGYFHLLYVTFRRQNRPNVLISRGAGDGVGSRCLISNMSASPVYLLAVIVEVGLRQCRWKRAVSDLERLQEDESATLAMARTRQGPLRDGDFIDIGTYASLIELVLRQCAEEAGAPATPEEVDWLRVTVAAVYTSQHGVVGATRGFHIGGQGGRLAPVEPMARQITRRRDLRALRQDAIGP